MASNNNVLENLVKAELKKDEIVHQFKEPRTPLL
jgi:vacuolar-type H+-ATPase subunit H